MVFSIRNLTGNGNAANYGYRCFIRSKMEHTIAALLYNLHQIKRSNSALITSNQVEKSGNVAEMPEH